MNSFNNISNSTLDVHIKSSFYYHINYFLYNFYISLSQYAFTLYILIIFRRICPSVIIRFNV